MKEIKKEIIIQVYDNAESFTKKERELINSAIMAMDGAWAKYSNFKVGSAVLLENGKIVIGNNQENAVFPLGLCAERVALFSAASNYPGVPVVALALSTKKELKEDEAPVFPCGSCRNAIIEQENKFGRNIKLLITGSNGKVYVVNKVEDILPFAFTSGILGE